MTAAYRNAKQTAVTRRAKAFHLIVIISRHAAIALLLAHFSRILRRESRAFLLNKDFAGDGDKPKRRSPYYYITYALTYFAVTTKDFLSRYLLRLDDIIYRRNISIRRFYYFDIEL